MATWLGNQLLETDLGKRSDEMWLRADWEQHPSGAHPEGCMHEIRDYRLCFLFPLTPLTHLSPPSGAQGHTLLPPSPQWSDLLPSLHPGWKSCVQLSPSQLPHLAPPFLTFSLCISPLSKPFLCIPHTLPCLPYTFPLGLLTGTRAHTFLVPWFISISSQVAVGLEGHWQTRSLYLGKKIIVVCCFHSQEHLRPPAVRTEKALWW